MSWELLTLHSDKLETLEYSGLGKFMFIMLSVMFIGLAILQFIKENYKNKSMYKSSILALVLTLITVLLIFLSLGGVIKIFF